MSKRMDDDGGLEGQVSELRDASRRLVRELGFMTSRWRDGERTISYSQCHALLELSREGEMTGGALAERLRLDKSSMSRAMAGLVRSDLVRDAVPSRAGDARQRPLALARAGKATVNRIDRLADAQVSSALQLLDEEERACVTRGLALYAKSLERARRIACIELRQIKRADDASMAAIIREVMTEFGAVGPDTSIGDPEVDHMSKAYRARGFAYLVAVEDGRLLGGAGFAPLTGGPKGVCELRKMYLGSAARGLGIGRALLQRCLDKARELGYTRCYLESLQRMDGAHRLYSRIGFRDLDGPIGRSGHGACNRWMLLDL